MPVLVTPMSPDAILVDIDRPIGTKSKLRTCFNRRLDPCNFTRYIPALRPFVGNSMVRRQPELPRPRATILSTHNKALAEPNRRQNCHLRLITTGVCSLYCRTCNGQISAEMASFEPRFESRARKTIMFAKHKAKTGPLNSFLKT